MHEPSPPKVINSILRVHIGDMEELLTEIDDEIAVLKTQRSCVVKGNGKNTSDIVTIHGNLTRISIQYDDSF